MELTGELSRLPAVLGCPHHLEALALEEGLQALADQLVVISQENPEGRAAFSGTLTL
jgi:hypothetical protein